MSLFNRGRQAAPAQPAASTSGAGAAISLEKVRATAPGIVDLYKHAGVSLEKRGLVGTRAAVYLVLDRSGSMAGYYQDGSVQRLAEQALGLSANLDDDGIVPLVFFDDRPYEPIEVGLGDYKGRIDREHRRLGRMGGTQYAPALHTVANHYVDSGSTAPAFVIFQTDGEPTDARETERVLRDLSGLSMFIQFVGFGTRFEFLRKLDALGGREVDNAGFFAAGRDPRSMSDSDLYDRLMGEYPAWLSAARAARIVA